MDSQTIENDSGNTLGEIQDGNDFQTRKPHPQSLYTRVRILDNPESDTEHDQASEDSDIGDSSQAPVAPLLEEDDPAEMQGTKSNTDCHSEDPGKTMVVPANSPHICHLCNKTYATKVSLKRHYLIHMDKRQFICEFCGKGFNSDTTLLSHRKHHSGERPYPCRFCPKTFVESGNRNAHERSHTGFRPYKCDLCDKHFSLSGTLARHRRTHFDVWPFFCNICGNKYRQRAGLKKHQEVYHPELFPRIEEEGTQDGSSSPTFTNFPKVEGMESYTWNNKPKIVPRFIVTSSDEEFENMVVPKTESPESTDAYAPERPDSKNKNSLDGTDAISQSSLSDDEKPTDVWIPQPAVTNGQIIKDTNSNKDTSYSGEELSHVGQSTKPQRPIGRGSGKLEDLYNVGLFPNVSHPVLRQMLARNMVKTKSSEDWYSTDKKDGEVRDEDLNPKQEAEEMYDGQTDTIWNEMSSHLAMGNRVHGNEDSSDDVEHKPSDLEKFLLLRNYQE